MIVSKSLLRHLESRLRISINKYDELGTGTHNHNYVLYSDKGKYVLRVYSNSQFDHARREYMILKRLSGHLSPDVFLLDTSKKYINYNYIVQEFLSGNPVKKLSDDFIVKAARLLRQVHSVTDKTRDRPFKNAIGVWVRSNMLDASKVLDTRTYNHIQDVYRKFVKETKHILPLMSKYKRISLVHEDPVLANFFVKGNKLFLLDWEFAVFDFFWKDVATFISENHLTARQEDLFLREYGFGNNKQEKMVLRYAKISRTVSLLTWLIERISGIRKGKKVFVHDSLRKHLAQLKSELDYIDTLFAEHY